MKVVRDDASLSSGKLELEHSSMREMKKAWTRVVVLGFEKWLESGYICEVQPTDLITN